MRYYSIVGLLLSICMIAVKSFLIKSSKLRISLQQYHKQFMISTMTSKSDEYALIGPKVLVPIANGTEELEAVTIIDTLVRGGCHVIVASVNGDNLQVKCSRGVNLVADKLIQDCMEEEYELIVCPGGMPGAVNLRDSSHLTSLLQRQKSSHKLYGAICAAPAVVLASHGLLEGKSATCYPASKFQVDLPKHIDETIVVSDNVITSKGPGTALAFSLKLVEILGGKTKADAVAKEMLVVY